jgi:hypothetical protein
MCSSGGGGIMSSATSQAVAKAEAAGRQNFQRAQDGVRSSWSADPGTGGPSSNNTLLAGPADSDVQPAARRTTLLGQ